MNIKTVRILAIYAIALFGIFSCNSTKTTTLSAEKLNLEIGCVAFYNLENLFDTVHNIGVNDYEYTPTGTNKWNAMKYNAKLHNMSYAISQIGLDFSPAGAVIVGVSEIENSVVLKDLVKQPSIAERQYEIVHYDGPDRRGVDVALLYNPRYFTVSSSKSYFLAKNYLQQTQYKDAPDSTFRTRDQLLVSGYLFGEKIHIIVNHWPSRTGGQTSSNPLRTAAASLTRHIVDSLFAADINSKIIVMGDLNDDPSDESCATVMNAKRDAADVTGTALFNVFWKTHNSGVGSLAYQGRWNLFDQIMLSPALLAKDMNKLHFWKSEVFNRQFLTWQEGEYKGTPHRTHSRGVWVNGYSDHYPTLIYLIKEKKK
ncbi:MAG: endonuclease/exonuclease/phosphatase family protein [Prevotellaceae bacterium]|jgi:predicted extracellular nuclease|nr:endonuclease/exonuclease/phosphatase family protein [Prevotellaceae bacterium]